MPGISDTRGDIDGERGWYEQRESADLAQGDLLIDFPAASISWDRVDAAALKIAQSKIPVVVLTQTCDIPKAAQTEIMLAAIFPLSEYEEMGGHYVSSDFRKALSQGTAISDFALPSIPGLGPGYWVVNFRKLFVLPKAYVQSVAASGQRCSLRSPYREYFAQAYARFVMRVGLPLPLPEIPRAT